MLQIYSTFKRYIQHRINTCITLACLFLILPLGTTGQGFLPKTANGQDLKLHDYERAFFQWRQSHDLSKEKGWKWYARWLYENEMRANPDGTFPDQSVLFREAIRHAQTKNSASLRGFQNANWIPIGPSAPVAAPDSTLIVGKGRMNTIAFHPTDPATFWVGVAEGGVWKTTNSGVSWMPLTDDLPIIRISDIAVDPKRPDTMYISIGDYARVGMGLDLDERKRNTHYGLGVYKTTDGGQSWAPTGLSFELTDRDGSLTRRVFIDDADADHLIAAGLFGIRESHDGGDTWTTVFSDMVWDIERDPLNPNILYATTGFFQTLNQGAARLYKSTDFGSQWQLMDTGIPPAEATRIEIGIAPSDPNIVYLVAANINDGLYGVYRSDDAGATWTLQANAPNVLDGFDGTTGDSGQGSYDLVIQVDPKDPNRLFIGGVNLWGSDDGGVTWNGVSYWIASAGPSIHGDHQYMAFNPLDQMFYACTDGGLARTTSIEIGSWDQAQNDPNYRWPTQWETIHDGMEISSFYRMAISPANPEYVMAGAQDNATSFRRGSDDDWVNILGGDGMECIIHPNDERTIYASAQFGFIAKSEDGGETFLNDNIITGLIRGQEVGAWTTPMVLHPNDPSRLLVAFGNVWETSDDGANWTMRSDFADIPGAGFPQPTSAFAISAADPNVMYVAKRGYFTFGIFGEVWRTVNGGVTWVNISAGFPPFFFITDLEVDSNDPMTVWATNAGFTEGAKVYRSTDGGTIWENISDNLPNVPANTIVQDILSPNGTVYVGTDIGVYYTNDEIGEWQSYSHQLPSVVVTELEIHQNSRRLYASTFGRGLWASDLAESPISSTGDPILADWSVALSPNPNSGDFVLSWANGSPWEHMQLEIVDVTGRTVYRDAIRTNVGSAFSKRLDLDLLYGLYYLRLTDGRLSKIVRFVVE